MSQPLKLGAWEVRAELNRIDGPEGSVHLEPKAIEVLLRLAERPREVWSKDELLEAVWPDAFVNEEVLTQAIFHLRRALGDSARNPTYIETIPRRGYRLIAPVEKEASDDRARYRILEKVGEGGLAEVFLAEDSLLRRKVALKVVKLGMDTREILARFEIEQRALALLNHPNIAHVHDSGVNPEGRAFIVMDYVRGAPIATYCDRHALEIPQRLGLFLRVCRAVQHAHDHGILHRDLKPSNVLVEVCEGAATPRLIDFGLAKALVTPLTDKTLLTQHGQHLMGTPEYMSPEQAERSADIDVTADVYSLGALLYKLLTGLAPVDLKALGADSPTSIIQAIRDTEPEPPSQRLAGLRKDTVEPAADPLLDADKIAGYRRQSLESLIGSLRGDLDWIVMKALEKDRTRRYPSAAGLAEDLERHLSNRPVKAGPPGVTYRLGKLVRRRRKVLTAAALISVSTLGLFLLTGYPGKNADRALDSLDLIPGRTRNLTREADLQIDPAISPAGDLLAYAGGLPGKMRIYTRPMDRGRQPALLTGDVEGDHRQPRWSPSGDRLAFHARASIYVVAAGGGTIRFSFRPRWTQRRPIARLGLPTAVGWHSQPETQFGSGGWTIPALPSR